MDYLEQIKEDFSEFEPYSGDYDWDHEAFEYLKEKNYEKAEMFFKKGCLSDPDHHSGFEGLAYVYYIKGEFEKAEWFMQEALKRAKKFIDQDAIDLNVIEEMEASYRSLIRGEPLETTYGEFHPSAGQTLFTHDLDAWLENVYAAPFQRRFQMAMEALEQPLAFELLEEEEVEDSEELGDQRRLQDFFFGFAQLLQGNKEMEKCRQLLEKYRLNHPGLYRKDYYYHDKFLIEQALFHGEYERLWGYLDFFVEYPASGIDQMIMVLQLLQLYRQNELAEELSKQVVRKIDESKKVLPGGEKLFEDVLFFSTMERVYHRLQRSERPTLPEVNEALIDYEFNADGEMFEDIIYHLSPGDDRKKIESLLQNEADLNISRVFSLLLWQFNKYMWEEKGMNFGTFSEIYNWLMKACQEENGVEGPISADFFVFPRDSLRNHIIDLGGLLSTRWPMEAALIWGVPHVYDFLFKNEIISESHLREATEGIGELKEEFRRNYKKHLWHYSFVHRWPLPDTVNEEEQEAEKEEFRKNFFDKPEVTIDWDTEDQDEETFDKSILDLIGLEPEKKKKQQKEEKDPKKKKAKKKEAKKQRQKQRKKKK